MGIYDRDYYQDDLPQRSRVFSGKRSMVMNIIVVNVIIAILDVFSPVIEGMNGRPVGHVLSDFLALHTSDLVEPWYLWRLLTAGFTHASFDMHLTHILFNMYSLWLFGRDVEATYGPREFLRLYLVLIVGASAIWLVTTKLSGIQSSMVGASGAIAGITVLFILLFPNRQFIQFPFFFPVPAWILGIILIGGDALGFFGMVSQRGTQIAFAAHLGGALLGFVYYRSGIKLESIFPAWRLPVFKSKPRLRVVSDDSVADNLERRADEILAKMHEHGADSLTPEERRILNDFSRRMRQKLR
jgi:membrane associated rhomboid family serine protease